MPKGLGMPGSAGVEDLDTFMRVPQELGRPRHFRSPSRKREDTGLPTPRPTTAAPASVGRETKAARAVPPSEGNEARREG